MTERDMRQFRLLRERLTAFTAGRLSLFTLNGDVEALLNEIEELDDTSRAEYVADWSLLEQVVASEADAGARTSADSALVSDTVARLLRRVERDLASSGEELDD